MPEPRSGRSLDDWLAWQATIHPRGIDMGLERIRQVWRRLGAPTPAPIVITVGGTNGKGSTVAFLDAMLRASGKRVGIFTSPHLLRYNERVRIDGIEASDELLIQAFEQIEIARQEISLTYFEYGTLAAVLLFAEHDVDVAVLEVGLGGRLDAVNLIDADVSIVTTIDLDHQDWLGNDKDSIAREKAGIFRAGRAAIIGEPDPPQALLKAATQKGARVRRAGLDFRVELGSQGWRWCRKSEQLNLPMPNLGAPCQIRNAAAAIAAVFEIRERIGWQPDAIAAGISNASVNGRMQRLSNAPELIVDVAHNPQAAHELALWMQQHPVQGRNLAVFGALDDKDVVGMLEPLRRHVCEWHLADLSGASPRGLGLKEMEKRVTSQGALAIGGRHVDVCSALDAALRAAGPKDRVIAFGSFFVVAAVLAMHQANAG